MVPCTSMYRRRWIFWCWCFLLPIRNHRVWCSRIGRSTSFMAWCHDAWCCSSVSFILPWLFVWSRQMPTVRWTCFLCFGNKRGCLVMHSLEWYINSCRQSMCPTAWWCVGGRLHCVTLSSVRLVWFNAQRVSLVGWLFLWRSNDWWRRGWRALLCRKSHCQVSFIRRCGIILLTWNDPWRLFSFEDNSIVYYTENIVTNLIQHARFFFYGLV